jgi:hypothetical protein
MTTTTTTTTTTATALGAEQLDAEMVGCKELPDACENIVCESLGVRTTQWEGYKKDLWASIKLHKDIGGVLMILPPISPVCAQSDSVAASIFFRAFKQSRVCVARDKRLDAATYLTHVDDISTEARSTNSDKIGSLKKV